MAQDQKKADPRQTMTELTARFYEKASKAASSKEAGALGSVLRGLHDLFTKDVTREGLRDLLKRDPQDAFRYFTRDIDFAALRPLPWYRRYPEAACRVFIALAYQLTPPRRIAFAVATFALLLGFVPTVKYQGGPASGQVMMGLGVWWLISLSLFAVLLLMELRDKLSLKADLEIAREIQFSLVPASPFIREGVHIHCRMRPANTVGGDYYDIIELGDPDRLAIVIGDVAGKGMPAALLMALLQGSLRTLVSAGHRGPELIAGLNRYLCSTIPDNSLVTLFYGELELRTGRLRYVNAGHNAPFLLRNDGAVERLHATSLVLGVLDQSDFPAAETQVAPGDQVLLFTDGVVEAMNPRDEEFGDDRLSEFLRQRAKMAQPELLAALTEAVLAHSGERRPHDDMTLMSVVRA